MSATIVNPVIPTTSMVTSSRMTLDGVRGMLMGAFLGDALGAPHEFRCNANTPYTGRLEHSAFHISRFQGRRELPVASVTDDSEMMLALLRQLLQDGVYNQNNVTLAYMRWANSDQWAMGTNTRELLKGVKTLKGYQGRIAKVLALPVNDRSQSNGSLMRCAPLALLTHDNAILEDVNITNPNPINQEIGLLYIHALRQALAGVPATAIYIECRRCAAAPIIKDLFESIDKRQMRDVTDKKGWCLHAFWIAMVALLGFTNYAEAMRWIITIKGSDTDTNACIAGALLGAVLGFDKLNTDEDTRVNIAALISCQTSRPAEYTAADFYQLTNSIMQRFS